MTKASSVFIEIGATSFYVLQGERGIEGPLERLANGRLTEDCRTRVETALRSFLGQRPWQTRLNAFCAIGSRGVSLRRLALPSAAKTNTQAMLRLQIESEFPVPADELAWGYQRCSEAPRQSAASSGTEEFLIVALKKEVLQGYADVLNSCGLVPTFTLAALARRCLCPRPPAFYAVLDIGNTHSEWISIEDGTPASVRVISWGSANIENREGKLGGNGHLTGQKIYLTGGGARLRALAPLLAMRLGDGIVCEPVEVKPGEGRSAATVGLRRAVEEGQPVLELQLEPAERGQKVRRSVPLKWVVAASLLALLALTFPWTEALLLKPHVAKQLAALQAAKGRLTMIDRELEFLRSLKQTQPPHLDALYVLAKSAPGGTRFDSLAMSRHGEVTMRGSMHDAQQVMDFRSKLIASGFFTNVALEEQSPVPNQQKVTVRISAQWKSAVERAALAIGPTADEIEKAKAKAKEQPFGGFPGPGGFPGAGTFSMPAGMDMPPGMVFPGPGMDSGGAPRPKTKKAPRAQTAEPQPPN